MYLEVYCGVCTRIFLWYCRLNLNSIWINIASLFCYPFCFEKKGTKNSKKLRTRTSKTINGLLKYASCSTQLTDFYPGAQTLSFRKYYTNNSHHWFHYTSSPAIWIIVRPRNRDTIWILLVFNLKEWIEVDFYIHSVLRQSAHRFGIHLTNTTPSPLGRDSCWSYPLPLPKRKGNAPPNVRVFFSPPFEERGTKGVSCVYARLFNN